MKRYKSLFESDPMLKIGDSILFGKFKNKQATISGFGTSDIGQPTVITDRGELPMYSFRIKRLMK